MLQPTQTNFLANPVHSCKKVAVIGQDLKKMSIPIIDYLGEKNEPRFLRIFQGRDMEIRDGKKQLSLS